MPGEKTGVIAYGYADGKPKTDSRCCGGSSSEYEDFVRLEGFTVLTRSMPFSALMVIHKRFDHKKLVFVHLTTKEICEGFARAILDEAKNGYL